MSKIGRKPNRKADLKAVELRLEGKKLREIGEIIGEDVKNVHGRLKRVVGELSTVAH